MLGIDDGYKDLTGVTGRPDASKLGIIDKDDVMLSQFSRLNISNIDIEMFILAYADEQFQSYTDYINHKQSKIFKQEGKQ